MGGWWEGLWTKTKLMLISTQVEVVVEVEVELGNFHDCEIEKNVFTICRCVRECDWCDGVS